MSAKLPTLPLLPSTLSVYEREVPVSQQQTNETEHIEQIRTTLLKRKNVSLAQGKRPLKHVPKESSKIKTPKLDFRSEETSITKNTIQV